MQTKKWQYKSNYRNLDLYKG